MKLQLYFKEDYETFLNPNRFYSYNDIHFFVLMGGRGMGKTTSFLIKCLKKSIFNNEKFVLVRRYKNETQKAKKVFDKISPNIKPQGIGEGGYEFIREEKTEDNKTIKKSLGYLLTLSMQATFKSGVNFDDVTTIIFDEAILKPRGAYRYLHGEVEEFLELISTIVRLRKNYKVFILGNNLDYFNPYYEYFKVPRVKKQYIDRDRKLYIEEMENKEKFKQKQEDTPLHALIKGTAYGDYHDNNKVLSNYNGIIGVKSINATLYVRYIINDRTLNIYLQEGYKLFVELRNKIIKDNKSVVIYENSKPNYGQVKEYRNTELSKFIYNRFSHGKILYENETACELFNITIEEVG